MTILLVASLLLMGCGARGLGAHHTTFLVEGVYLGASDSMTLLVRDSDGVLRPMEYKNACCMKITLMDDVAPENRMWARVSRYGNGNGDTVTAIEAHIHSTQDVQGGDWDRGKFGHGQTTKID